MMPLLLFLATIAPVSDDMAFECDDADRPFPVVWQHHIWEIVTMEHSKECFCGNYDKYNDDKSAD
jgi:hypothetical protein